MKWKVLIFLAILVSGYFLVRSRNIAIEQSEMERKRAEEALLPKSPLTGLPCKDATRRPFAVMLSSDPEARPLSGVKEADLLVEMTVVEGSITRLMALYICGNPETIGSVRSARHDFIPLAQGWDAMYAHWGGSHFALERLRQKIINNIDALPNPFDAFYRASGIPAPHDGFTSIERLVKAAKGLKYRLESRLEPYPHVEAVGGGNAQRLTIPYRGPHRLEYQYDPASGTYERFRGGMKEGEEVAPSNLLVLFAPSRVLEGQYNDVQVEGTGKAILFRNGERLEGKWSKPASSPRERLKILDAAGEEMVFAKGQVWIHYVEPGTEVSLKNF